MFRKDETMHHRRNRVTPFGELESSESRGGFMGNRGDLHAADGSIRRKHAVKFWICCTLEERRGQRVVFDTPGHYTPLFFWDEAVALAAGHRPCAQCRRADFRLFRQAYNRAKGFSEDHFVPAKAIDAEMHASRLDTARLQRRFRASAAELPSGTFVTFDGRPEMAVLLWQGLAYPWSPAGYGAPDGFDGAAEVNVLTPRLSVDVMRAGYGPAVRLRTEPGGTAGWRLSDQTP